MTDDEQAQDFASPLTQSAILTDAPALLQQANRNPDQFWADHAKTLTWQEPWKTVSEITLPDHQWFVGGRINACENALDRHVHAGDGDGTLFARLTGSGTTTVSVPSSLTGGGTAKLRFTSDDKVGKRGFSARVTSGRFAKTDCPLYSYGWDCAATHCLARNAPFTEARGVISKALRTRSFGGE